ncbi:hypothetical protein OAU26_08190 [Mariniblastus sp.]|nr:hypothetical protein [Mariniblastus sp.]
MNENETTVVSEKALFASLAAANAGDKQALALLKKQLKNEEAANLTKHIGDMAFQVESSILNSMLKEQLGSRTLVKQHLQEMRQDLGWESSQRMERMLIERVVQTWLYLHMLEAKNAQATSRSFREAKFDDSRIEKAQNLHLKAVKMLATVRKLALPTLVDVRAQINVVDNRLGHVENIAVNPTK